MLRFLVLLTLAVWVYAFIDCLNTSEKEVRKLPKVAWVLIILFFGVVLVGPIAWFVVGRPRRNAPYGATRPAERRWVAPDDNPEFLKSINEHGRRPSPEPEPGPSGERDSSGRGSSGGAGPRRDGERGGKRDRDAAKEKEKENGGPDDVPPTAS